MYSKGAKRLLARKDDPVTLLHQASVRPEVSVLLTVYNGERYVEATLRSMMRQTLTNIELIVVDDASTDGTPAILARLAHEDRRIRVVSLPQNVKAARASNHGLALIRAPLLARMDADDLSHPERLAVQKRYMDAHPNTVALGTSLRRLRADGSPFQTSIRPRDAFMCRWILRFRPPILHPAAMIRYPLSGGERPLYNEHFPYAQDYELFWQLSVKGDLVCLADVLVDYRHHHSNVSVTKWAEQTRLAKKVSLDVLNRDLPPDVVQALRPVVAAYFDFAPVPPAEVFGGLRRMLRHDLEQTPAYRSWLWRQTAQLAYETLARAKLSKPEVGEAFLRSGRDLLGPLLMRMAEIAKLLPRPLASHLPDLKDKHAQLDPTWQTHRPD